MGACANNGGNNSANTAMEPAAESVEAAEPSAGGDKVLVAYFSRTGDNYAVGNIEEGNTAIIAKMIAEETGGELFEIEPVEAYPADYTRCTEVAKEQLNDNVRPTIKGDADVEAYDVIYIGYPVWWGEAPMPVYTFIDKHDWNGKTVIPFCTHEGSGLSGTKRLAKACAGATTKHGLAIKGTIAQSNRDDARKMVKNWLAE
ncbi:MAG: NAD(P)H-dependent oxidoreductase [Duncaniella sp.]|nr:NAD(P)H-dependent oxidoreductase [Duncaniella sp.]